VNPDNGPGSGGSQPDENYAACIPRLRPSGGQVVVLGYVDSSAPSPAPLTDIDTYAGWDSSYRPTGIFLDLVSPTANLVNTYQSYVSHATSKGFNFVTVFLYLSVSANSFPPDGLRSRGTGFRGLLPNGRPCQYLRRLLFVVRPHLTGWNDI
jgi:hypothetical protein